MLNTPSQIHYSAGALFFVLVYDCQHGVYHDHTFSTHRVWVLQAVILCHVRASLRCGIDGTYFSFACLSPLGKECFVSGDNKWLLNCDRACFVRFQQSGLGNACSEKILALVLKQEQGHNLKELWHLTRIRLGDLI